MKYLNFFAVLCLLHCVGLIAHEEKRSFQLSYETVCITTINEEEKYQSLDSFDAGCHKTILRIHDYPYGKNFVFEWERPLFKKKPAVRRRLTINQLKNNAELINERTPLFVISSRGFLPGEQVMFTLKTADGFVKTKVFNHFPHPLFVRDKADQAGVFAELESIEPTAYSLWLIGFKMNEKLKYTGVSGNDKISAELVYTHPTRCLYVPKLDFVLGGTALVTVERESGVRLSLPIVWGNEFIPYLKGEKVVVNTNFEIYRSGMIE